MNMSQRQTRMPRLYKVAGKILKDVSEGVGSLKSCVYSANHPNRNSLLALCGNTLQHHNQLDELVKEADFLHDTYFNPWVVKILLAQLFWGVKPLQGDIKLIKTILAHEHTLRKLGTQFLQQSNTDNADDFTSLAASKPRYVRINTLKITVQEAIDNFIQEGCNRVKLKKNATYRDFLNRVTKLKGDDFLVDYHLPDVLVFAAKTVFHGHNSYEEGYVILQDKASCLPVHFLRPVPNSIVLDMCAGPGMKTSQMAAAMSNLGKILAYEINTKRYETLNGLLEQFGVTCASTRNADVLAFKDVECNTVEYILVDPSCTGSGLTDRIESYTNETTTTTTTTDENRVKKLSNLQLQMLRFAMTRFPKVKRIVYSTCSLNRKENENVVRQAVETIDEFKLVPIKELIGDDWINFGSVDYGEIGASCLYCTPDTDHTIGFFIAVFERLESGERNVHLNKRLCDLYKNNGRRNDSKLVADDGWVNPKKHKSKHTNTKEY